MTRQPAVGDYVMLWGRISQVWPDGGVIEVSFDHSAIPDAVLVDTSEFERVGEVRGEECG